MAGGDNDPRGVGETASVATEFAKRHHLGGAEFAKACEALAPAFALALARAAEAPERWTEMFRAFPASDDRRQTNAVTAFLDGIFGGNAVREAVERQASAMTGVASSVVAAAMPHLAALGAEAMMRGAVGGFPIPRGTQLPTDPFGPLAAEMMRRSANAVEAFSRPSGASQPRPSPVPGGPWFANPFMDAFTGALRANPAPSQTTDNPLLPFAALFDAFAAGMRSSPTPADPAAAHTAPSKAASPSDLLDAFAQSGQRFREDYAKGMAALFERLPSAGGTGA